MVAGRPKEIGTVLNIEAATIDAEIGRLSVGEGHPRRGNHLPDQF
jgi:hypothetical protein